MSRELEQDTHIICTIINIFLEKYLWDKYRSMAKIRRTPFLIISRISLRTIYV